MYIVYGTRLYGRIEKAGGTCVATKFAHVDYLPLFPLGSMLVLEEQAGGNYRAIPIPLNLRSVLAAYLRVWGFFGVGALVAVVYPAIVSSRSDASPALIASALLFAAFLVYLAAFFVLGGLSLEQHAQRLLYWRAAGIAADVGLLGDARDSVRSRVHARLADRGRAWQAQSYRTGYDPVQQWAAMAMDAGMVDLEYLGAALTLSRLEWSLAQGAARAQLASLHDNLWQKIRSLDRDPLGFARQDRAIASRRPLLRAALVVAPALALASVVYSAWTERARRARWAQESEPYRDSSYNSGTYGTNTYGTGGTYGNAAPGATSEAAIWNFDLMLRTPALEPGGVPVSASTPLQVGDHVEVWSGGSWRIARIDAVYGALSSVRVQHDDGSYETVSRPRLRWYP